ncbi:MAG: WD40 repeat protein [Phycisphaerales bacterium]
MLVSTDSSIYKFDLEKNSLGRLVSPGDPGNAGPQHMSIGSDGNLYVANFRGGLQVYDLQTGDHVRTIQTGPELVQAAFMTIRDDVLIVSTFGTDRVLRYDLNNNDTLMSDLLPKANVRNPHHILWLDNGEILASMGTQVSRFAADGTYLGAFTIQNIATATSNIIVGDSLVVNNFGGSTQRYNLATGAYLGEFNLDGKGDGAITLADGSVLLAYNTSQFVRWYDADGNFIKLFG